MPLECNQNSISKCIENRLTNTFLEILSLQQLMKLFLKNFRRCGTEVYLFFLDKNCYVNVIYFYQLEWPHFEYILAPAIEMKRRTDEEFNDEIWSLQLNVVAPISLVGHTGAQRDQNVFPLSGLSFSLT